MSAVERAWILAGSLEGAPPSPDPRVRLAGMPLLLRHACEARVAGATRIEVIWIGEAPPPEISDLAADERLAGSRLELRREVPEADGRVLLIRADRVFHRDLCKRLARADSRAPLTEVAGSEYDGAFVATAGVAAELASAAAEPGGVAAALERLRGAGEIASVEPPYLGFSVAATDRAALRRAEKLLVTSLRKSADGFAAQLLNRRISLFLSRYLARTPIRPNHVTVLCFLSALAGGIIISRGGYWNGLIGMLLVELGSILDGIDGELARLKHRFSRVGQWMDTVTDDLSNVFLATGTALSLHAAGLEWALPLWGAGLAAFVITQSSQYYFIATIYDSGDLAAIPWAFQSTEFLSSRPTGLMPRIKAGVPKLLKRDFAVTLFVVLAALGFLEGVLLLFAGGAIGFLISYSIQYLRARPDLAAHRAERRESRRSPSAG